MSDSKDKEHVDSLYNIQLIIGKTFKSIYGEDLAINLCNSIKIGQYISVKGYFQFSSSCDNVIDFIVKDEDVHEHTDAGLEQDLRGQIDGGRDALLVQKNQKELDAQQKFQNEKEIVAELHPVTFHVEFKITDPPCSELEGLSEDRTTPSSRRCP
jgi:hypothetical protein